VLLYGNTVVWKPSPLASVTAARIAAALAPLPPGVVNVVLGKGSVAAALVEGDIAALTVVGSEPAVRWLGGIACARDAWVDASVAGAGISIVLDGADVATAANRIAEDAFAAAGQRSGATKIVIVEPAVATAFQRAIVECVSERDWGPVSDSGQVVKVSEAAAAARTDGRAVLAGGGALHDRGEKYVEPTIVELRGPGDDLRTIWGPIIGLVVAEEREDIATLAGPALTAYVFSDSNGGAKEVTDSLRALLVAPVPPTHPVVYMAGALPRRAVTPADVLPQLVIDQRRIPHR
jgi:aldehyde dehydrogenase (NAD+)